MTTKQATANTTSAASAVAAYRSVPALEAIGLSSVPHEFHSEASTIHEGVLNHPSHTLHPHHPDKVHVAALVPSHLASKHTLPPISPSKLETYQQDAETDSLLDKIDEGEEQEEDWTLTRWEIVRLCVPVIPSQLGW
jgi:hypothetical protein